MSETRAGRSETTPEPLFAGVIAHRGGGRLAPENTLAGLRMAATLGYRCVEFDVMLIADGTPVLIHDDTLDRTTLQRGEVARLSSTGLAQVVANRGFEDAFPDEPLPTLAQAAAACASLGLAANVEIKPFPGTEARTGAVVAEAVARAFAPGRVLLSSFSESALASARQAAAQVPRALLFERLPGDWLARIRALEAVALHAHWADLPTPVLAAAAAAGLPVRCYTVNDPVQAVALLAAGVSAVFTDALDLFQGFIPPCAGQ